MKRLLTMLVLLTTAVIAGFALSESAIVLHHGDEVTVFDGPDKLPAAMEAAVDGDVIFLNKGTYAGFTLTKDITIRGAGSDQTQIAGDIYVDFTQTVEEGAEVPERTTLEGLYCQNYIYWDTSSTNRKISKCNFEYFNQTKSSKNYNFTVDRCVCRVTFFHQNCFEGLNIINSKINDFYVGSYVTDTNIVLYRSNIYEMEYCNYFSLNNSY